MQEVLYYWQHFYELSNRVAFSIGSVHIYYYALCYIAALLLALKLAKYYAKFLGISEDECDKFFIYLEIGIILGARLGYIFIYSPERLWYLANPWQIFNPFNAAGEFVGIAGMSYHGACIGAVLGAWVFAKKQSFLSKASGDLALYKPTEASGNKASVFFWLDLVALAAPFAYTLGRIGNFLNHELFGRETNVPWGVYVDGVLRHPSQLYEGVLEGLLIGIIMHLYLRFRLNQNLQDNNHYQLKSGEFILLYAFLYSLARFVCEFYRQPDAQLGFLALHLSMGQWLSVIMLIICIGVKIFTYFRSKNA